MTLREFTAAFCLDQYSTTSHVLKFHRVEEVRCCRLVKILSFLNIHQTPDRLNTPFFSFLFFFFFLGGGGGGGGGGREEAYRIFFTWKGKISANLTNRQALTFISRHFTFTFGTLEPFPASKIPPETWGIWAGKKKGGGGGC